jgi:hypothetical protein
MKRPGYPRNRRWTRLEVAIWISALAFMVITGILVVTQVVGHWVLPVGGGIAAAVGLMRYRAGNRAGESKR